MGVITAGRPAPYDMDLAGAQAAVAEAEAAAAGADASVAVAQADEEARLNSLSEEELQLLGLQILDEACAFIERFSVLPSRAAKYFLALFAAHCWIYQTFTETPRCHISALGYGAGKTRVMKLVLLLCPNPQMMARITGPAIYHIISERHPAPLALDEADAMLGTGGRAEDVRGILNAGYEYSGSVTRVQHGVAVSSSVFCPVIFAGKGELPQSLKDRSVSVMMTQRLPGQKMDRFIPRMHDGMGRRIGLILGSWATRIQGPACDILWDDPPEKLADRQVDILTPLYAICQMAGGPWPERFDEIVDVLLLGGVSTDEVSPATALLTAIADVWPEGTDRLATYQLAKLVAGHKSGEFNWPEQVRTKELNARMRDLGISPAPLWIDGRTMRGYERAAVGGHGNVRDAA